MLPQALQLIPYVAIASAILLGIAIVIICFSQGSRRVSFGVSWRQSILAVFQRFWLVMSRARLPQPGVIIHDPDSAKPHDLDDPFFDPKVREQVGAVIANAALKRAKSSRT
jgi:hypothetical protein